MWRWRRMDTISRRCRVKNEEVLLRVKEETNFLHPLKRKKLLKHIVDGKIEGKKKKKDARNGEATGIGKGSTRSHFPENSFWKRLWICRKADCAVNESYILRS
jgi:hypothetical protein